MLPDHQLPLNAHAAESAYTVDWAIDEPFTPLIDTDELTAVIEQTLHQCGRDRATLTVVITTDEAIQALNRDYRGVDAPTDVLSFASQDAGAPDDPTLVLPPEVAAELADYLGDLIIAYPYAERQAAHFQNPVAAELRLLVVHGVLHLLGYDHATPAEEAAMWARQEAVLAHFGDHGLSHRPYDA
jgi:probable rRNA maturation factor